MGLRRTPVEQRGQPSQSQRRTARTQSGVQPGSGPVRQISASKRRHAPRPISPWLRRCPPDLHPVAGRAGRCPLRRSGPGPDTPCPSPATTPLPRQPAPARPLSQLLSRPLLRRHRPRAALPQRRPPTRPRRLRPRLAPAATSPAHLSVPRPRPQPQPQPQSR